MDCISWLPDPMKAAEQPFRGRAALGWALWLLLSLNPAGTGADWPQYRGPNHDGVSTDRLNKQWTGTATNAVWLLPLTNCLGSMSVSGGRVFTQARRVIGGASGEVCVALATATGTELWSR